MTPLKLQGLLVLAALMLSFMSPTETKVVNSTKNCPDFFLQQTPPNIPGILDHGNILDQNRYKLICQTLNGTVTFVTLYDTTNKIPVFSASKYKGHSGKRPRVPWMVEPQLENSDSMQTPYRFQAGPSDYNNRRGYNRGHLLPSSYGLSDTDKNSTFTLTNIIPQVNTFNQKSWSKMETCVRCVLDKYCTNNNNQTEGFVVIGAKPSNNNLLNRKINIPSMLWSAFCCYSGREGKWIASAHWGENGGENVNSTKNTYLQTKTLAELYTELGEKFNVFPGTRCPLNTTVTKFYPDIDGNCTCPPSTTTARPTTTSTQTTTSVPTTFSTHTSGPTTLTPNVSTTSQTNTTTTLTTTTTDRENPTISSSLCDGLESGILRLICEIPSWLSPYFDVLGSPPKNTSVTLQPRAAARPPYKP